jgi:hypothetical protein
VGLGSQRSGQPASPPTGAVAADPLGALPRPGDPDRAARFRSSSGSFRRTVRTRRTLADAGRWYAVNRVGGWCLPAASLCYLAQAAVLPSAGSAGDVASWLLHLAAFVGPLALGILVIHRYGKTR